MSPVGGTNFVFYSYGKFNPGYRDEKCPIVPPKYPWNCVLICQRPQAYKPCTLENVSSWTMPVSGLECSYGNRYLGNWASPTSHMNISKFLKRNEARSRKRSQPCRPGSYEEALSLENCKNKRVAAEASHCLVPLTILGCISFSLVCGSNLSRNDAFTILLREH